MYKRNTNASRGFGLSWHLTLSKLKIPLIILLSILLGAILLRLPLKFSSVLPIVLIPGIVIFFWIIKYPVWGIMAVYFIEYARPQDQFPQLAPLRIAMLTTIVVFVSFLLSFVTKKRRVIWTNQSWVFLFYMALIGLTVLTARNNFWAYRTFYSMMLLFVTFFLATNLIKTEDKLKKFIWMLLIIYGYIAIKGIYQYLAGNPWGTTGIVLGDFLSDENDLALALVVILPFSYFLVFHAKTQLKRLSALFLLFLYILCIVFTMSRGGFIGLVAVLGYCWWKSPQKIRAVLVGSIFIIAFSVLVPKKYVEELKSIRNTTQGTAETRREYWKAGFKMFKDHPIIGVGAGNDGIYLPLYYKGKSNPNTQWGRVLHGTIPQVMSELGIIGFFCFLAFFCFNFRDTRRISHIYSSSHTQYGFGQYVGNSVNGSMIGFLVASTFLSALYYPHLYTITAITVMLKNSVFSGQGIEHSS